jgi:dolichol kinase
MPAIGLEARRNLFHLGFGMLIVAGLYYDVIGVWALVAIVAVGFAASMASRKRRIPFIGWFLERFERREDLETFPGRGAFFATLGFLLAVALFEKDIALAAITIFVLGDSLGYFFGVRIGRIRHPLSDRKFLEGSMAGFLFAFLGASLFVTPAEALVASLVAMTMEAVDFVKGKRIEDNVTIPLFAGAAVTLMRALL